MPLTKEEIEFGDKLRTNFEYFARHIIKIDPKDLTETDPTLKKLVVALADEDSDQELLQGTIPFIFHPGQSRLDKFRMSMQEELGLVRIAIVKPRQVGWSTYILAYIFWLCTLVPGLKVHIVSHNKESTEKFIMRLRTMCAASPSYVSQRRKTENRHEIRFANNASITIATAGSPDALRSDNCHILLGSEESSWPNPMGLTAALMPALSDGPGSAGFRESSAKGRNTPWHNFIRESQAGENLWRVFFDPWFAHPKYKLTPPPNWQMDDEAKEVKARYKLTIEQMFWRAMKIKDLRATWMFKQEYPSYLEEAFQSSENTLYNPDVIDKARRNYSEMLPDKYAPLILGIDPARTGDRTVLAFRQGKVFREIITFPKMEDMRLVGIIAGYLKDGYNGTPVSKCFIDYAIGEGPASRLRELGYSREVVTVHFGETPREERYANKRIEMAMDLREWLGDTGEHVALPDSDDMAADLLAIPDFVQATGSEKLKLISKELIKKDYHRSPDIFDAMILTFAYPVQSERIAELQEFARNDLSHLPPTGLLAVIEDFERE